MKATGINPAKLTTDLDETYMGVWKRVGVMCHGGTVSLRAVQRYVLGLAVKFEQARRQRSLL